MIQVTVSAVLPDVKTGTHVLLLRIGDGPKHLPVWIGAPEADAIRLALANQSLGRPLTHDLLKLVLEGVGAKLSRIVITSIQDSTFYARLVLERDQEIISIDARPSDSVALALRTRSPMFVTEELLQSQKDNLYELEESGEGAATAQDEMERDLDELLRKVERGEGRPQGEGEA